jgi:hypothetical protein
MVEHPGVQLDLLRPGDFDAGGGCLQGDQGAIDITSSRRPSCPACTSAVPNQVRSACSSSTAANRFPRWSITRCRSMRAVTAASNGQPECRETELAARLSGHAGCRCSALGRRISQGRARDKRRPGANCDVASPGRRDIEVVVDEDRYIAQSLDLGIHPHTLVTRSLPELRAAPNAAQP